MKKIAASLLLVIIASSSFGAYKAMHKRKKKQVKKTTATAVPETKIKSVLMGRAACFGQCPAYSYEIFANGLLRYTGKSFVPNEGVYEKNIGAENALRFIKEFDTIRPDTLSYLYPSRIADLPGIYYFISYQDSVKKVLNAEEGPRILKDWAKKFDEFGQIDGTWTKQKTTNNTK